MNDSKKAARSAVLSRTHTKPQWRKVALLLVVFVAGGVTGAVVATSLVNSRLQHFRNHPEELPDKLMPVLSRRLALNERQAKQVDSLFRAHHSRIVELRRQSGPQLHAEFDQMVEDISRVLDARQTEKWKEIARSVRMRFLPRNPGGGSRPGSGPPSGGGPPAPHDLFENFDANFDGELTAPEVPGPVWHRLSAADMNNDGVVTLAEVHEHLKVSEQDWPFLPASRTKPDIVNP